ncbi:diguanylate cyclase [Streptomyces sp. NBC_00452]|nr:diguanylate cyclase [Streptomyces sp. NBC_00452]
MQDAIESLHHARSLAETMQAVADGVVSSLCYEVAAVNLVQPDGDVIVASFAGSAVVEEEHVGHVGSRAHWDRLLEAGQASDGLPFIAHAEGQGVINDVPQWYTDGPSPRLEDRWHPSDRLLAPMYTSGVQGTSNRELIGVLAVGEPRNKRRPGLEQRRALKSYALQAAIAISNARLRANMQRALVRLEREQQAIRASEESFRQAFEYAPSGMAIAEMGGDQHGRILRTNDALCRLLARPASAMRRCSFSDFVHPDDMLTLLRVSAEGGRAEVRLGRRDGTYVWVSLRNSVVADAADGPRFLLTHVEDIQERKLRELQLQHAASHDPLTDLPNSAELRARLSARVCATPEGRPDPTPVHSDAIPHAHLKAPTDGIGNSTEGLAVLSCDLDGFKKINERFGHNTGDAVLIEVARRLRLLAQQPDTVARLGGDHFVVLADGLSHAEAQDFATRVRNEIIQPFRVDTYAMRVGISIGISWAQCGMEVQEILHHADQQMYIAKRSNSKHTRLEPTAQG